MDPVQHACELDANFRTTCARLGHDLPWFAEFALEVDGQLRRYKIGDIAPTGRALADERILSFLHPLAAPYYEVTPGEDFLVERTGPGGDIEGTLAHKSAISAAKRALLRVDLRHSTGNFTVLAEGDGFVLSDPIVDRRATRVGGLPDIRALLTREQYELITTNRRRPLIIQGRAGSGKTTVALYRVYYLIQADERPGAPPPVSPESVLVVMFNRALRSFVDEAAEQLGLEGIRLDTFHGWALEAVRRAYDGALEPDPNTLRHPHASTAATLKKQLGILRALEAYVARQTEAMAEWLPEKLAPYGASRWLQRLAELEGQPVVRRLYTLRREALLARGAASGSEQRKLEQVHTVLHNAVRRMTQYKEDLLRLLRDQALLAAHLPDATPEELTQLGDFQASLQGRDGTERRPGPFVAFEDLALLLRLIQLKNGGFPDKDHDDSVQLFDHLLVDEAQDFGAVELTALLASVRSRTGVTIVGDTNQKIVPEVDFMGWDALAAELGITGAAATRLEVAHRSTAEIMAVADTLIGDQSPATAHGARPTVTLADHATLADELAALVRSEVAALPHGHVCVVCAHRKQVPPTLDGLRTRLGADPTFSAPVREGHNKAFEFSAGVTVTNLRQIKGLEFDSVIVLDPSPEAYPPDDQGRRHLYTLVTRAKDRLAFLGTDPLTPLLAPARATGLLEVVDRTTIEEVTFTDEEMEPF